MDFNFFRKKKSLHKHKPVSSIERTKERNCFKIYRKNLFFSGRTKERSDDREKGLALHLEHEHFVAKKVSLPDKAMKSHEEAEEYPMIKLITSKFSSFLLLVVTFIIQFKRTNKQRQCENDILESRPLSRGRKKDENSTSQHTLMSQIRHFLLSNYYGNIRRSSRLLFHSFFVVLSNPIKMLEEH